MNAKEPSDETLVRAARAGDREAFAQLVDRHMLVLLAVCRRVAADRWLAEDAAQESVVQAMVSLERLRDGTRFGPWLLAIGVNVTRRLCRRRNRADLLAGALLGGITIGGAENDPAAEVEQGEVAAIVREGVLTLPEGQRRAIQAFYFDELSYEESAAALGTRAGSIKTRLHKARRHLKETLQVRLKEEEAMPVDTKEPVEVRVRDVRRRRTDEENDYHVVVLEEVAGERHLPIWVGPFEGTSIAAHLLGMETPRPLTFTLMASLLRKSGVQVKQVQIEKLAGETFYAAVELRLGKTRTSVDARPSDAIALALVEGVPIRVSPEVFAANEARQEIRDAEDKWHGEGTLGAAEIVAEVTARWRSRGPVIKDERK